MSEHGHLEEYGHYRMSTKQPTGALATVSSQEGYVDPEKVYDAWSAAYDGELIDDYGYVAPQIAADEFVRRVSVKSSVIIDLGCGTGRFSGALAEIFDANVLGVEPSAKMIERARAKHTDVRLRFLEAPGEALPVDDSSIDMVFMSMVLHHLAEPAKVALECWRALRRWAIRACLQRKTGS